MKGGSVSEVCKGYIIKMVWRAILALTGACDAHKRVISDMNRLHDMPPGVIEDLDERYPVGALGQDAGV